MNLAHDDINYIYFKLLKMHGIYCDVFWLSVFPVLVDSGSRYEVAYPSGISHFLEKLAFSVS